MRRIGRSITYTDARRYCGLSADEVRMAKELGISPAALIRTERSSRTETWKDTAGAWVRKLYEKRR